MRLEFLCNDDQTLEYKLEPLLEIKYFTRTIIQDNLSIPGLTK